MTCIGHVSGLADFSFDDTLREVCMVLFFTSVGFQANLKVLKSGGKSMVVFLALVIALIILQNLVAVGLSEVLHINPLIGICTGSISMVGGHGTAGAFGPVLEDFNVNGATTICTAAAVFQLILAIGLGTIFSWLLTKTGLTFPIYIGAMIAAALIRNISEYTGHFTIHMGEINDLGRISLSLFLGMAMITLKLWELSELALPLIVLLASQVILIAI